MSIQVNRLGTMGVLRAVGPLTGPEGGALRAAGMDAVRTAEGRLAVDLSACPFVDSSALETLVDLNELLRAQGQSLKLIGVNETIRQVLDLTDLAGLFEFFEDLSTAEQSWRPAQAADAPLAGLA